MPDINKAYSWAVATCNAPNVGYSQSYRNAQTVGGITYYDCSSFINYALLAGGFETPSYAPNHNAFTTYSEPKELLRLGFREVDAGGEYLAGDIGLSNGHTEMCYRGGSGKGVFMGAHTDNAPLANQVSIGSSGGNPDYERSFPRLFRYGEGGATGYGASAYVIAALAGNAWRESHINPTLSQLGGGAFGLFQWDGSRRDALLTWLNENGYENTSPNGQMEYLVVEGDWIGTFAGISSLMEFLTSSSTNVASLTEAFCTCWERPGVPALNERIEFAHEALEYILLHANDASIVEWETKPMYYLSRQQALHNAVLMYRFYSAGGGGGGTPSARKKKMPIWMWIRYH
jgi:hypothetical protein